MNIMLDSSSERQMETSIVPIIEENQKKNPRKYEETSNLVAEETLAAYLKRFVGMIVNFPTVDNNGQSVRTGKYVLDTDSENYRFLLEFTKKKDTDIQDLRKLDSILGDIFSRKVSDDLLDILSSSQKSILNILFSIETLMLVGVFICLYIFYNLMKSNFSFWYIIRYFLTIILIIDYAFRYRILYEEVEEHNMKVQYSSQCDTKKMDWKQYFLFLVDQKTCERRYVTPLEVALFQIKHIIIVPLSAVGTGMGHFGSELWRSLPFPWNFIIFPTMLFFIAILVAITLTSMSGSPFKINLLYSLLRLEFGGGGNDSSRLSGPAVERFLDSVGGRHRSLVEDVASPTESTGGKNSKQIKGKNSPPAKENKIGAAIKDEQPVVETIRGRDEGERSFSSGSKLDGSGDGPSQGGSSPVKESDTSDPNIKNLGN